MARQRKPDLIANTNKSGNSSNSSSADREEIPQRTANPLIRYLVGCTCLLIAIVVGYVGYLETRVKRIKRVVVKSGLEVPDLYWGTYRPGHYFGLKTRDYHSPVMGLMWYPRLRYTGEGIRHWYRQDDGLSGSGWLYHDGSSYGEQLLRDPPHIITTSFVETGQLIVAVNSTSKGFDIPHPKATLNSRRQKYGQYFGCIRLTV